MVEVWAMNPTPNSMYMAHQYRLLDCKMGFSANKSRKMVMQMFTISVVFFIFCCKFYTFFYVCMLGHCRAECRMMQRVLQRYGRPSAMFGNRFAAHPQLVRSQFRGCTWVYCGMFCNPFRGVRHAFAIRSEYIHGMFATCSFSVCYIFALQKYGFCGAKVWFLTCKKGVFELQKYGFCFLNVALLQSVCHVFAECSPHCCNPFATHSHPSATLLQSVSSAFAPHKQRCCNLFASKKPKPSMCIEEFRPPKIL